jgi:hypothetical protein
VKSADAFRALFASENRGGARRAPTLVAFSAEG